MHITLPPYLIILTLIRSWLAWLAVALQAFEDKK
jgi:hypothetical protein